MYFNKIHLSVFKQSSLKLEDIKKDSFKSNDHCEGIGKEDKHKKRANKGNRKVFREGNKNGEGKDTNRNSQCNSNQAKGGNDKNKCEFLGHDHNWINCSNNPKSINYNGTCYRVVLKNNKEKTDCEQKGNENDSKQSRILLLASPKL